MADREDWIKETLRLADNYAVVRGHDRLLEPVMQARAALEAHLRTTPEPAADLAVLPEPALIRVNTNEDATDLPAYWLDVGPDDGRLPSFARHRFYSEDQMRAALAASRQPAPVPLLTARALEWDAHGSGEQWTDQHHDFSVMLEPDEDLPYCATWGEGDTERFSTLEQAQAWCQAQINAWVAQFVVSTSSDVARQPAGEQTELAVYKRIAWLIGSIYVHGNFKAETCNERELESLLRSVGCFWESLARFDADLLAAAPSVPAQGPKT